MSRTRNIAVLVAICTALPACASSADVSAAAASTTSSAPATTAPTTIAPTTTTTTTTIDADEAWGDIPGWSSANSSAVPAYFFGTVRTINFTPEFSFWAPEGSGKGGLSHTDLIDMVPPDYVQPGPVRSRLVVIRRSETSVEETAEAIATSLGVAAEFEDITVGGAPGMMFGADSSTVVEEKKTLFLNKGGASIALTGAEAWHFWIVDVAGEVVTFAVSSPLDDLESNRQFAQDIVASVVWKDLA